MKINNEEANRKEVVEELSDNWWYRVYLGVIVTTIAVITALGLFSAYFSS